MEFLTYNTKRWINSTFLLIIGLYAFRFQRELFDTRLVADISLIVIVGLYGIYFAIQVYRGGTKSFQTFGNVAFVAVMSLYAVGFQWLRAFLDQKIVLDITLLMALGAYAFYLMYETWRNK